MKKFKKALSLLTALIMAVSVINVSGIEAFADYTDVTPRITQVGDVLVNYSDTKNGSSTNDIIEISLNLPNAREHVTLNDIITEPISAGKEIHLDNSYGAAQSGNINLEPGKEKIIFVKLSESSTEKYFSLKITREFAEIIENPADSTPQGYFRVTFAEGANGQIADNKTYDVKNGVSLPAEKAPAVQANAGHKFTGWDKELPLVISKTETITAQYAALEDIIEVENPDSEVTPQGYFRVTFAEGANGQIADNKTYDVKNGVSLPAEKAPAVQANAGHKFTGWDKELPLVISKTETITAQYAALEDIIEVENPDSEVTPQGYFRVTFAEGANGQIADNKTYDVKNGVSLPAEKAPAVQANAGHKFTGWDKELPLVISKTETITAQYTKLNGTITIPLPDSIKDKVQTQDKTQGSFGFVVENNPVTHVEIKKGQVILTLTNPIEQGKPIKVEYNPSTEPKGALRSLPQEIKTLPTITQLANKDLEIPRNYFFRSGDQGTTQKLNLVVKDTPVEAAKNFDGRGNLGFTIQLLEDNNTPSTEQGVEVSSVAVEGGKIVLNLNKEIKKTQLVKVTYKAPAEESKKLYLTGRELTAADIPVKEGVVSDQGTIVDPAPKADNSSRGFGGGSSRSSVRPNSPDRKSNDKKDIKMVDQLPEIKPDSKVSTKLTIGDMKYTVVVDGMGVERTMDVAPMVHMGRTVLPARMISEILGVEVKYDPATRTANFMYGEEKVQLTLGQKFMMVNGKSMPLTADILNVRGRILLPLTDIQKAFAELGLKATVEWDADTKSVTVNK
ncbi:MAG: copper amine oxidase N-terminal domain-containing protein [Peptostreptococcaceae bacterium]|nr:copper amine oxidase N-terminal domain-containing protein [Peptostreptococcaceae bacterium]